MGKFLDGCLNWDVWIFVKDGNMKWLIICLLILSGCRLYWHDEFFILAVGESEVQQVDYIQEPNCVRFHMVNYKAGEKVKPSIKDLIIGE